MRSKDTRIELVADLERRPTTQKTARMRVLAIFGFYHSKLSPVPDPKSRLMGELLDCGFKDIAFEVAAGIYTEDSL